MIDTKQLVQLVRDAEENATSPEDFRALLLVSGVLVEYRRDGVGQVNGWKLRPAADSSETDWLKGSELTADRSFSWSKLAARKGWLIDVSPSKTPEPAEILAEKETEENSLPVKPDALAELLLLPPEPKPEPELVAKDDQEQQLVSSLEMLVQVLASMIHRIQALIARLVNSLLERLGIGHRIQVWEGVAPRLRQAPAPVPKDKPTDKPKWDVANSYIQKVVRALASNDLEAWNNLVSKVPQSVLSAQDRKDATAWIVHRKLLASEDMAGIKLRADALPVLRGHVKDAHYDMLALQELQLRQRLAQLQEQHRQAQKKKDFQSLLNRPSDREGDQSHQHHRG